MPRTRKQGGDFPAGLSNPELFQLSEFLKVSSRPVSTGNTAEQDLLLSLALALRSTTQGC
jgi:hypothetical protein